MTRPGEVLEDLVNEASVTAATADADGSNNAATTTTALDTSDVEVDLPAAGVTSNGLAASGIVSLLLGLALLRFGRRSRLVGASG